MAHFSDQVHISIGSFTQNVVYYDLHLLQPMADHHHFSFVWQYTGKTVIKPEEQAQAIRSFLGDEVIFTFKSLTGIRLMSKGIVTELSSVDENGAPSGLRVKGISHTLFLDDVPKSRTFNDQTIEEIALKVCSEGPGEFYQRDAIKATVGSTMSYLAQYNETNFAFLKRLAYRYGQWFYFDGMRMQFGQIRASKLKLINGASLHNFTIHTHMFSHKVSLSMYDYRLAKTERSSDKTCVTGSKDSFSSVVRYNQGTVTNTELNLSSYMQNAQNADELSEMVKLQVAAKDANSIVYSGLSYLPIGLGQIFTLVNQNVEHELIAIEVQHHSKVYGNYCCEFKAIPADVAGPPYTNVEIFAKAASQPATVIDNNDPAGLGRVQVEFHWSGGSSVTDWIRMLQPHAGPGKGFYFLPEIGEEVMVSFEADNVQSPYVIGTHYNGSDGSGYASADNEIKVIHTKSGTKMVFNDAEGSILIEDPSGATWHLDGQGNIDVNAPNDITISAGGNINISAGLSINSTAATTISESAGADKCLTIGGVLNTIVGGDSLLRVVGNLTEYIEGNLESNAEKDRQEVGVQGISNQSEGGINSHAKKELQYNSAENSKSH